MSSKPILQISRKNHEGVTFQKAGNLRRAKYRKKIRSKPGVFAAGHLVNYSTVKFKNCNPCAALSDINNTGSVSFEPWRSFLNAIKSSLIS